MSSRPIPAAPAGFERPIGWWTGARLAVRQEEGTRQGLMAYDPRRRKWAELTGTLRTPKRLKIRGAAGRWVLTQDESVKHPAPMRGVLIDTTTAKSRPFVAPMKVIVQPFAIGEAFVFSTTGRGAPHTDGLQLFVPATGKWRAVTGRLPDWITEHRSSALATTEHVLLKFGGTWQGAHHNEGLVLDTRTAKWRPVATQGALSPRANARVAVRGSKVALWGGSVDPARPDWELGGAIYDAERDRWSALPIDATLGPFKAKTTARLVLTDTHLVVFRGEVVRALDLRTKAWRQGSIPRQSLGAIVATDDGLIVWSAAHPVLFDPFSMRMCQLPGDGAVDEVLISTGPELLRWGGVALTTGGCENFRGPGGCDPWTKRTPRLTGEHLKVKRRRRP